MTMAPESAGSTLRAAPHLHFGGRRSASAAAIGARTCNASKPRQSGAAPRNINGWITIAGPGLAPTEAAPKNGTPMTQDARRPRRPDKNLGLVCLTPAISCGRPPPADSLIGLLEGLASSNYSPRSLSPIPKLAHRRELSICSLERPSRSKKSRKWLL
jgi:hypothetical protein